MGEWSIMPVRDTGELNIEVHGDYKPEHAIELGLSIIESARRAARSNGTPRLTFEGPTFKGPKGFVP